MSDNKKPLLNQLAVQLPFLFIVLGMVLVFASVVFSMFTEDSKRIIAVSLGLAFLLGGVWFTANPYIVSTRTNQPIREQVKKFLGLIRELHAANEAPDPEQKLAEVRAGMLECVDRLTERLPDPPESSE
jgi:hypothetical protein